ncbi:mCG145115, partial [Mus musculus]
DTFSFKTATQSRDHLFFCLWNLVRTQWTGAWSCCSHLVDMKGAPIYLEKMEEQKYRYSWDQDDLATSVHYKTRDPILKHLMK